MPMAVKKRKSAVDPLPCSPMKIMTKDPRSEGGRRIDSARTNLTNALLGLSESKNASPVKDENEAADASGPETGTKELLQKTEPALLRRKKKIKSDERQAFVMKLFDRSVDLALFDESTPLYPICRAWMQNLPKKINGDSDTPSDVKPKGKKKSGAEKMDVDEEEEVFDVDAIIKSINSQEEVSLSKLPPPIPLTNPDDRAPSPIPYEKSSLDSILNSDMDSESALTKEALLQEHLTNWAITRKKWHEAERRNEDRYKDCRDILEAIYNKAQKNFQ